MGHDTIHVSPAQVSRCIDASMHRYALNANVQSRCNRHSEGVRPGLLSAPCDHSAFLGFTPKASQIHTKSMFCGRKIKNQSISPHSVIFRNIAVSPVEHAPFLETHGNSERLDIILFGSRGLLSGGFMVAPGKKLLPSHIWCQKNRNYIPYKMVKSTLRSSLGKLFY